jgi:tetratricopeptide (TPR) repeat protein
MGRCFSCGLEVQGGTNYLFTCPACDNVTEIKKLRKEMPRNNEILSEIQERGFSELANIQQDGFERISYDLEMISGLIEWGFSEISWELKKQEDILNSIDETLKTPFETKANELRYMAEELQNRGVLDEAEKRFIKSLDMNPLDYRTHVGLAQVYLKMNNFAKARRMFEKSLPHGTKELQNYSLRLIGRTYFCEENYTKAANALKDAIELLPQDSDSNYDFAQYSALVGDTESAVKSLKISILTKPLLFSLASHEKNFSTCKNQVQQLLDKMFSEEVLKTNQRMMESERVLKKAKETVIKVAYCSEENAKALSFFGMAKNSIAMNTYHDLIYAQKFLDSVCDWSLKAIKSAEDVIKRNEAAENERLCIEADRARMVAKEKRVNDIKTSNHTIIIGFCSLIVGGWVWFGLKNAESSQGLDLSGVMWCLWFFLLLFIAGIIIVIIGLIIRLK